MQPIQYIGLDKIDKKQVIDLDKIVNEHYTRLQRMVKNECSLVVNFKEYNKEGKRVKFSIHARLALPGKVFEADAHDWDFRRTLHKALKNVAEVIEKKLKVSEQHG
jgi:ribosome-associated translation inhibitor RaiA